MKFTRKDLAPAKNMLKALGKGEWKLDGQEILAFGDMMRWYLNLTNIMEAEIMADEAAEAQKAKSAAEALAKAKEVQSPIQTSAPKASGKSKAKKD